MKKFTSILMVALIALLAICLGGCSGDKSEATDDNKESEKEQQAQEEEAKSQALMNLAVGQSADFSNYTITLDSVEQSNEQLLATVTVNAKVKTKFKPKYLEEVTTNGETFEPMNDSKIKLDSGESITETFEYTDHGAVGLKWEVLGEKAQWNFEAKPENFYDPNRPKEPEFEVGAAIGALDNAGKELYPYGFEVKTFTGMIAVEERGPNSFWMKYYCEATNEFGATEDGLICEGIVTGTGTDPNAYTVENFTVY